MSRSFVLFVKSPEFNEILGFNKLIDSVIGLCAQKRRSSIEHNEKDDSSCKQISSKSSIVSLIYFWGFVSFSSNSRGKFVISMVTFCVSRESKIRNLECKMTIKEDILRLEVTMGNINAHQVLDCK